MALVCMILTALMSLPAGARGRGAVGTVTQMAHGAAQCSHREIKMSRASPDLSKPLNAGMLLES